MSEEDVTICSSPELTDDESGAHKNHISISDDNTESYSNEELSNLDIVTEMFSEEDIFSDDDSVEKTNRKKDKITKSDAINLLFPKSKEYTNVWISGKLVEKCIPSCEDLPSASFSGSSNAVKNEPNQSTISSSTQHTLNIGGVAVDFPLKPYSCQIALMFKVITGINKRQNCLLESPTGTGKTLILLCGALAWQRSERERLSKLAECQYFADPDADDDLSPAKSPADPSYDHRTESFKKKLFGERSIYDDETRPGGDGGTPRKRNDLLDSVEASQEAGLVTVHKRRKMTSAATPQSTSAPGDSPGDTPASPRLIDAPKPARVPKIYYGARTHKQIQQVVKELKRTSYVTNTKMSILSSREHSCIRQRAPDEPARSKNDMCRELLSNKRRNRLGEEETSCNHFNNRRALCRAGQLPAAWDLEDLVSEGRQLSSCPYFAARAMAEVAHIVFCPYNYLIDPAIRESLQIDVSDDIVILDEAHNIEDVCRESASLVITRDEVIKAIDELEAVSKYTQTELGRHTDILLRDLKNWDYWFQNQKPLLKESGNSGEWTNTWSGQSFAKTLEYQHIGYMHYHTFADSAHYLGSQMRDNSVKLYSISNATVSMLEALATTLGYMFRECCAYIEDFKPTLSKTVSYVDESPADAFGYRSAHFKTKSAKEVYALRLQCMNPAIVFSGLQSARCVVLSSGTLTPLVSLHSELDCRFPLVLSTKHVIPDDRVWIGSLSTCPDGASLECTSKGSDRSETQDALGEALAWVCRHTPHGVLCFMPSYGLMNKLAKRWQETGLWQKLNDIKYVFMEARNVRDHSEVMEEYYRVVGGERGALLIAVYRGKVSEGMDFRDEQARAVVTVGIPYPNTFETMVSSKMKYNDSNQHRQLLPGREWLRVQAYRALNQALGRCVRHRSDWGAVLMIDSRFQQLYYTQHLSRWIAGSLCGNHHTWSELTQEGNSFETFMENMTLRDKNQKPFT